MKKIIETGKNSPSIRQLANPVESAAFSYCRGTIEYRPAADYSNMGDRLAAVNKFVPHEASLMFLDLGGVADRLNLFRRDLTQTESARVLKCDTYLQSVEIDVRNRLDSIRSAIDGETKKANETTFFKKNMNQLNQTDLAMIKHVDFNGENFRLASYANHSQATARIALNAHHYLENADIGFVELVDTCNRKYSPDESARLDYLAKESENLRNFEISTCRALSKLKPAGDTVSKIKSSKTVH